MSIKVLASFNFGVKPAQTTLSDVAIASIQTPYRYAWGSLADRTKASPGCRTT